ncbi:MAG: phage terminase small subunit P27 family [Caldilineaceae bacterium]
MGRKATPTPIKKLRGGDPRNINDGRPEFSAPATMRPPAFLGKHGRQHWKDLFPLLVEHDLLTAGDLGAFVNLCAAYDMMIEALTALKSQGLTRLDENKVERKHPMHQIWRDSLTQYLKLADAFGLTPSAREGLHITTPALDPYEEYLRGKHED